LDGTESSAGTPDADTLYYLWIIRRSDTGVVDALFSESATSPTMPTNYDEKRLIGFVLTDASANIEPFVHKGSFFQYTSRAAGLDINDTSITQSTWTTGTLDCPAFCLAHLVCAWVDATGGTDPTMSLRYKGDDLEGEGYLFRVKEQTSSIKNGAGMASVLCNGSSQIEYRANLSTSNLADFTITTYAVTMLSRELL
jgi:hypothetical protein